MIRSISSLDPLSHSWTWGADAARTKYPGESEDEELYPFSAHHRFPAISKSTTRNII